MALEPNHRERFHWVRAIERANRTDRKERHWYRIGMPRDGSCFFHALSLVLGAPERGKELRRQLAEELTAAAWRRLRADEGKVADDPVWEGQFERYQRHLRHPNVSVGAEVFDWVSQQLGLDIYIIRLDGSYVYTPAPAYRRRRSVILLHLPNHYELLARKSLKVGKPLRMKFSPRDPLIRELYEEQMAAHRLHQQIMT